MSAARRGPIRIRRGSQRPSTVPGGRGQEWDEQHEFEGQGEPVRPEGQIVEDQKLQSRHTGDGRTGEPAIRGCRSARDWNVGSLYMTLAR